MMDLVVNQKGINKLSDPNMMLNRVKIDTRHIQVPTTPRRKSKSLAGAAQVKCVVLFTYWVTNSTLLQLRPSTPARKSIEDSCSTT